MTEVGMATMQPQPARARILVIDDEEMIVRIVARALGRHEVVCETNPRAALARIAAGEQFDLVLCDMKMPGLSGMDVHAEIAATMPSLLGRLVFLTGGAFTPAAATFLASIPNDQLEKTAGPRALLAFVDGRLAPRLA